MCDRTLNPRWDEEFQISVYLHSDVRIRVYDKDFASKDDFMGEGKVDLYRLSSTVDDFENISIQLEDQKSNEDLGYIHFDAKLIPLFSEVRMKRFLSLFRKRKLWWICNDADDMA